MKRANDKISINKKKKANGKTTVRLKERMTTIGNSKLLVILWCGKWQYGKRVNDKSIK